MQNPDSPPRWQSKDFLQLEAGKADAGEGFAVVCSLMTRGDEWNERNRGKKKASSCMIQRCTAALYVLDRLCPYLYSHPQGGSSALHRHDFDTKMNDEQTVIAI